MQTANASPRGAQYDGDEHDRVGGWEELYVGACRKALQFLRANLGMFLPQGQELINTTSWLDACDQAFRDYESDMVIYEGESPEKIEELKWKVNIGLGTELAEPEKWSRRRILRDDMIRCLDVLKRSANWLVWLSIHQLETSGHPLSELHVKGYIFWSELASAQRLASHAWQLRHSLADVLVIHYDRDGYKTPRLLSDEPKHIEGVIRTDGKSARQAWKEWGEKPAFPELVAKWAPRTKSQKRRVPDPYGIDSTDFKDRCFIVLHDPKNDGNVHYEAWEFRDGRHSVITDSEMRPYRFDDEESAMEALRELGHTLDDEPEVKAPMTHRKPVVETDGIRHEAHHLRKKAAQPKATRADRRMRGK